MKQPLEEHLKLVRVLLEKDLASGWGRVLIPDVLNRKYPNASKEWRWQWIFPQENRWNNPETGEQGRHRDDFS